MELEAPGEQGLVKKANNPNIKLVLEEAPYSFPKKAKGFSTRPVIVGMGPAGLFAALVLARAGADPILLERGKCMEGRCVDVDQFWKTGKLNPSSNVQFGEGGAGTFSDGKLTTGTHDKRIQAVLSTFQKYGAPEDILYSFRPHIGTDILRTVIQNIRKELLRLGCDVRFEQKLIGLHIEKGTLTGIKILKKGESYSLPCDTLILAPGHSARDTFRMLEEQHIPMEQKPIAIGLRIEHKQAEISKAQFGDVWERIPPSDYKLSCHLPNGRSAFTFCVCPGGEVVASASEEGQVVTNGMSRRARDGENINGGFLVGITTDDYPGEDPLAGVRFQEHWEREAWMLAGENSYAPAQLVRDFLEGKPSKAPGSIHPSYSPGVKWTNLKECLPDYVFETLREALPIFDRKIKGFAHPDSVLTGVETRSSSPVRILRNRQSLSSIIRGLYPCGEGAGYAGGIVSAAVDGIRVAEAVLSE